MARSWALITLLCSFLINFCFASLVNYTIDDTFGDERTGSKPYYESAWVPGPYCSADAEDLACSFKLDVSTAWDGTWHATVKNATMSFTFEGSAIYLYFITVSLATSSKNQDPVSLMSIFVDGSWVSNINRLDIREHSSYDEPWYTNDSLSAGLHNVTIKNHALDGEASASLISGAIFDYAVYSYDSDGGSRPDAALRTAVISVISGILFLGICSLVAISLRSRARRLSTPHVDPWVDDSGSFINAKDCPRLHVIDLDSVEKQDSIDSGDQGSNAASWSLKDLKSASLSSTTPSVRQHLSPLDKNVLPKEQVPSIARNLKPNVDVFLMRSSFAFPEPFVQSRRRSTLSRLGVRLGEHGASRGVGEADPLYALQEREMARTTGVNRLRSHTDAQPAFVVSEEGEEGHAGAGALSRQEDAALIAQLQTELHILRIERSRRGSFPPVEEPPAYEELLDDSE